MKMKRILFIISAVLLLASCGREKGKEKTTADYLYGEWHSTSISVSGDVYLSFTDDMKFEMFQKIGDGAYRLYRGTWNVEGDLLTGKYNDGEDWAAAYTITVDDKSLTMTSVDTAAEKSTYDRTEIPESVRNNSETVVKCSGQNPQFTE